MDFSNISIKASELIESESYTELVDLYSEAIIKDPGNAEYWSERAVAKLNLRMPKKALEDFEIALQLDPFNPYRYASRAYAKDKNGDLLGAIEDYKKTLTLDPEDAITHNNLGMLEEKAGRSQLANVNFEKANSLAEKLGINLGPERDSKINNADIISLLDSIKVKSEIKKTSVLYVISRVFTSKKTLQEFGIFIKNGFKISKPKS